MRHYPPAILDRKIRFALVGCGRIAQNHLGAMREHADRCELVGVCDVRKDRADAAAARFAVPAFYDAPLMLRSLKPDLVSVTTGGIEYGSDHHEPTIQALDAGCHVLGEKPICNDIAIVVKADNIDSKNAM